MRDNRVEHAHIVRSTRKRPRGSRGTLGQQEVNKHPSRTDRVLFWAVFGTAATYCFHGAVVDDLYFVGRSGRGAHLHGTAAWCLTAFVVLMGTGVWVREFSNISSRYRRRLEMLSYLVGFAVLTIGWRYA
jgi:hypothetical protein